MARRMDRAGVLIAGHDGTDQQMVKVDSAGTVSVAGVAGGTAVVVAGPAADDAAASGNPVLIGGKHNTTQNTVEDGDVSNLQTTVRGELLVHLSSGANANTMSVAGADGKTNTQNNYIFEGRGYRFSGTTWDRERGNEDVTVFASAARTATPTPYDGVNYNARGLHLVIDCTVDPANASVVFTIQGKDNISGKFYTILVSAAIAATGTTVLRVFPGSTVTANVAANDILPRQWRVIATHADADSITYSVGASLIM